jgi:hypothetical protein
MPSDKKYTVHDFCELLPRLVAKVDTPHAQELGRQLEAPDSRLRMETVLVELEENQKILECLEIEVESPAKGKSCAANSSDKKKCKTSGGESSHSSTIFVPSMWIKP